MVDWTSPQCYFELVGFIIIIAGIFLIFLSTHPWWAEWYEDRA